MSRGAFKDVHDSGTDGRALHMSTRDASNPTRFEKRIGYIRLKLEDVRCTRVVG